LGPPRLPGPPSPETRHAHARRRAGTDIDLEGLLLSLYSGTAAGMAFVLDNFAGAAAGAAGDNIHHLTERRGPGDPFLTGAVAGLAGVHLTSRFGAAPVAMITGILFRDGKFLPHAFGRLAESDFHIIAQVIALFRTGIASRTAAGEHVEDIAHVKTATEAAEIKSAKTALTSKTTRAGASTLGSLLEHIRAHLVILRAFVRVGKNMVSLVDFLELFLRFLRIVLVQVRMVLPRQFAVCFFDIFVGGVFLVRPRLRNNPFLPLALYSSGKSPSRALTRDGIPRFYFLSSSTTL